MINDYHKKIIRHFTSEETIMNKHFDEFEKNFGKFYEKISFIYHQKQNNKSRKTN